MYNVYWFRKSQQERKDREKVRKMQKRRAAHLSTEERVPLFERSRRFLSDSLEARRVEVEGCIPLLHPAHHSFRSDSSPPPHSIYLRTYEPSAARAEASQSQFRSDHLNPAEPYNPRSPHNTLDWMRPSAHAVDKPHKRQFTNSLKPAGNRYIPDDTLRPGAAINHKFRDRDKEREVSPQGFAAGNREFREPVWNTPNPYSPERYVDGLEAIGNVRKPREKQKEISPKEFRPEASREWLLKDILASQSIRSRKAEDFVERFCRKKKREKSSDSYPAVTDPSRLSVAAEKAW